MLTTDCFVRSTTCTESRSGSAAMAWPSFVTSKVPPAMTAALALVRATLPLNNVGKPDDGVPPGPVAGGLVMPPSSTVVQSGLPPQPGKTVSVTREPRTVQTPIVFAIVATQFPARQS